MPATSLARSFLLHAVCAKTLLFLSFAGVSNNQTNSPEVATGSIAFVFVLQCLTGAHGAFDRRHHRCASLTRSSTRCCSRAVAVIRLQIQEQIVDVPVPQIKKEIVEIVAGEVVCNARTGVRRQHGWTCTYIELIVDVPVPRIHEQIVDVIKVIPEEWMSKRIVQQIVDVRVPQIPKQIVEVMLTSNAFFFLLTACGKGGCGRHVPHVLPHSPPPHARVVSECKRWNLEHVVLDVFSHFTVGKVQDWWLFVSCRGSRSPNSPFALSRLANLTHAVAARLSLSVPTWQHVYRRVLRELDIDFEPGKKWTLQFLRSLQLSWKLAATCTRSRPSEADIARERKLLQLRVIYLSACFGKSQDRKWNLDETVVRMIPAGERGWTKRSESTDVFASRAFVTVTLAANTRGGMWTQIVYEEKTDRVRPHGPLFPRQLVSHSPTHWITQNALLDMIDAIDANMNARRDAEQRNFIAYAQPLDRAHMRAFKSSIRQEVAKHFAELFLEVESNFERANHHIGAPTAAALIRAHSSTERRQPATSRCWLALHRLERGGAA